MRIFLSHTTDLARYPDARPFLEAAKDAVHSAGHGAYEMAMATASDELSKDWCEREVRTSDKFIGLIGFQWGSPVREDPSISYTEYEYEVATRNRLERLVFILDEEAVVPAQMARDLDHGNRQERFRRRLRDEGIIVDSFKTPDELYAQVYQALVSISPPRREPPFMAPRLPSNYVDRAGLAAALLPLLTNEASRDVGLTTGLRGAGGFGKTTMAAWLCHQPQVRARFPDGVLWVTLGESLTTLEVLDKVADLCRRLSGERPGYTDPRMAGDHLGSLLGDLRMLMVIDDVWNPRDLAPFLAGGDRCVRIITTRNSRALPEGAAEVVVDKMTNGETINLLRQDLAGSDRASFGELLRRSGSWPLLAKLMNGVLRAEVAHGSSLDEAIVGLAEALRERGPAILDVGKADERERAVTATMEAGLKALERTQGSEALERYVELAVFAEGAGIPLSVLERYWAKAAFETRQLTHSFFDQSLIEQLDTRTSKIRLSPVVQDYLRHRCGRELHDQHRRLLDAFRPLLSGPQAWFSLPPNERYLWFNLAHHLAGADLCDELVASVTDPRYIVVKAFHFGPGGVEADLAEAKQCNPADDQVLGLQAVLRPFAHRLTGFMRRADLAATLRSRIQTLATFDGLMSLIDWTMEPPYLLLTWCVAERSDSSPLGSHVGSVYSVESDALGSRVVSCGDDGLVRLYDGQSGRELLRLAGHGARVNGVRLDPSGERVVSGGVDGAIRLWDATAGEQLTELWGHVGHVNSVGLDRTGTRVVSGGADGTVRIWDTETGAQLQCMEGHDRFVNSVRINPSGTRVVSGGADGFVRVWDADSGGVIAMLTHCGEWEHQRPVNSVAIDRAGLRVASGGADHTVKVWSLESEDVVVTCRHDSYVNSVSFDGSGSRVVSGSADGTVRIWDAYDGHLLAQENAGTPVTAVAFDDTGTRVVWGAADGTVRIYAPVPVPPQRSSDGRPPMVKALAVDRQGGRIASGGSDGRIRLWQTEEGSPISEISGHEGEVNSVDFDSSGRLLASGGSDGQVRVSEAASGRTVLAVQHHGQWVNSVRFDQEGGRVVSGGADGTIRVVHVESGRQLQILTGHGNGAAHDLPVNAVAFAPSGSLVASAGADRTVRVWDLGSEDERLCLSGHRTWVNSVAFDVLGRRIASAGYDGDVRIWDAETGEQLVSMQSPTWITSVEFDQTGKWVITGGGDGAVRVWDAETGAMTTQINLDGSVFACRWGPGASVAVGTGHGIHVLRLVEL